MVYLKCPEIDREFLIDRMGFNGLVTFLKEEERNGGQKLVRDLKKLIKKDKTLNNLYHLSEVLSS
jgi:hypothetical protein